MEKIPDKLKEAFITKEIPEDDNFALRLWHNGEWRVINIDNLFPCKSNDQFKFLLPARKQLWPILLEKAFAKLYGNYSAIYESSLVYEKCLSAITGLPFEKMFLKNSRLLMTFEKLVSTLNVNKNDIVTTEAYSYGLDKGEYEKNGLKYCCHYFILDARMVNGIELVHMKNYPRLNNSKINFIWNGDWSFNSNKWTPLMENAFRKQNLPNPKSEDSTFWISFSDLTKYFNRVFVHKLKSPKDSYQKTFSGHFPVKHFFDSDCMFDLDIRKDSLLNFSIFCNDDKTGTENYGYLIVDSEKRGLFSFIEMCNFFAIELLKGRYKLILLSYKLFNRTQEEINQSNLTNEFSLTVYSRSNEFNVSKSTTNQSSDFIKYALIQATLKDGVKKDMGENIFFYKLDKSIPGILYLVQNCNKENDGTKTLMWKYECNNVENLEATRSQMDTFDAIAPMNQQITNILLKKNANMTWSLSSNQNGFLSSRKYLYKYGFDEKNLTNYPVLNQENSLHFPQKI